MKKKNEQNTEKRNDMEKNLEAEEEESKIIQK